MNIILIIASIIFGLIGGIALTCLILSGCKPNSKPASNGIRLWRPSRQRRETLKRATQNAKLMVAGGTIDFPTRRRA